ncbi:DNA/RNA non-specific endonuclease [Legionella genomosp. 1]|uniref:DNA/RNA non-specific endonuclease n=1 Tax=Legionella genomosp. 1 TaxID=1093625 RepID=UPI001055CB55|nr:DNA/RNA non-specific endonuclease [Legionella genomosp. 1]
MIEQIESFLLSLQEKKSRKLSPQDWNEACRLHLTADTKDSAKRLTEGLAAQLNLPEDCIDQYISKIDCSSDTKWYHFNYLQENYNQEKLALFAIQSSSLLPAENGLNLTPYVWFELYKRFDTQERERLSRPFLQLHLARLQNLNHDNLIAALAEKKPRRSCTPFFHSQPPSKRKRHIQEEIDYSTNRLILAKNASNTFCQSPLKDKGVRIAEIQPTSPAENCRTYLKVGRTPGGREARLAYRTETSELWTHTTPDNNPRFNGALRVPGQSVATLKTRFKHIWERAGKVTFTATLHQIEENQNKKRPCNQFTIFRAACKDVFKAHGVEIDAESTGHMFHWTHLIALFLGGEHDQQSITAATRAANLNILEAIENDTAEKLKQQWPNVPSVRIEVTPHYQQDNLIPQTLHFMLSWTETNSQGVTVARQKEHFINACSHQRYNKAMLDTFKTLDQLETERISSLVMA